MLQEDLSLGDPFDLLVEVDMRNPHLVFLMDNKVEIELDGGMLEMELTQDNHVLMNGAVAYVFEGMLSNMS